MDWISTEQSKQHTHPKYWHSVCQALMATLASIALSVGCGSLMLCSTSCTRASEYYSHVELIKGGSWNSDQEIFFSFPKPHTLSTLLSVKLVLRMEKGIRLKKLPLGITLETPSHQYHTIQVLLPLQEGKEMSQGYHLRELTYTLSTPLQCNEEGFYTVSLRHLATQPNVKGIIEVGVVVTEVPPHSIKPKQ